MTYTFTPIPTKHKNKTKFILYMHSILGTAENNVKNVYN